MPPQISYKKRLYKLSAVTLDARTQAVSSGFLPLVDNFWPIFSGSQQETFH